MTRNETATGLGTHSSTAIPLPRKEVSAPSATQATAISEEEEEEEKPIYRITTFIKRKPGLSDQEFYNHWYKIHGPLCAPWIVKHGILGYKQFHTPQSLKAFLSPSSSSTSTTSSSSETPSTSSSSSASSPPPTLQTYDGGADFYVTSLSNFLKAFEDEYYLDVIRADEEKFVDRSQPLNTTVGIERVVVCEGKMKVLVTRGDGDGGEDGDGS